MKTMGPHTGDHVLLYSAEYQTTLDILCPIIADTR